MSKKQSDTQEDKDGIPLYEDRTKEWKDDDKVSEKLADIYKLVTSGFDDKKDQQQAIERAWDIYNCVHNENQMYVGDSRIYLPIVHDAIEARVTRYTNAVFPQTGRYSDILSDDGRVPYEVMAVLDNYVERCNLREDIIPSLVRSGDITGQYSLYVSWRETTRHAIKKKQVPALETDDLALEKDEKIKDIEVQEVNDGRPDVSVLDSRDLVILPASVDEAEDADVVAIALRMSKGKIQDMIDSGDFDEEAGEELLDNMTSAGNNLQPNPDKKALNAAGIQTDSKGNKTCTIYQIWTKLKIGGKRRRVMAYMYGEENILSCKRNPYWSDRVPVITQAALKVNGSIWGTSRVHVVENVQYAANDAFNMGQDSIKYSLMPITAVDPEKFARVNSLILSMGAIWLGDPNAIKIIEFPNRWPDAERVVMECRNQIMQTLGINPAMIPSGGGKKPTQAQIAQEQQVALESTADVVSILEFSILNKLLRWFYELDYQFRNKAIVVRRFGPVGVQAEMQKVPPIGVDTHYTIKWFGSEGQKSVQQVQQMISFLGTLKQMPPDMLAGRKLDAGPIIENAVNAICGPRIGPKVLIDQRHMLSIPPEEENTSLAEGFCVKISPQDDHAAHIRAHQLAAKMTGDPTGEFRVHIQEHEQAMAEQQAASAAQQAPQGRAGAQVQPPTGPQNPPGAIHPDQMAGNMPTVGQ